MGKKNNSANSTIELSQQSNFLFKHCTSDWYPIITLNQISVEIKKDENVFCEGETVKGIYIINSGKIKVVSTYEKNKERILRLASDGKILGYRGIAAKKYSVSAIALTDTVLTFIPYEIFISLLKTNPNLSLFIIDFMAEELRNSEEQIKNMIQLEVKQRIACIILSLIDSFGYDSKEKNKLSYTLSRKDFASIAGTTYETVIRSLVFLQDKKLIKLLGKEISITNDKLLKAFAFEQA